MSLISFVSLLLILFNIGEIRTCSPPYISIADGCYKINNGTLVTWSEARQSCMSDTQFGNGTNMTGFSHLVAIEGYMERNALRTYLNANEIVTEFWIDGKVMLSEWSWSNNSIEWFFEADERNITGNGSNYKLVTVKNPSQFLISDDQGNRTLRFICEYQVQCSNSRTINCSNNGTCYKNVGEDVCICAPGFTGKSCETPIDDCLSSPCLHGGNCTDKSNNYTCDCSETFYDGPNCESLKPDPKEGNRSAAFWSVLGVVAGLIFFLTLSDLPWSDILTAIGCSCHRLTCCGKKDESANNNHLRFTDSPVNDNNSGVHIMRMSYGSSSSDPQYNGYRSPDHNQVAPQMGKSQNNSHVNTKEPRSKGKDPVDSMVNWTQQLQEQLKSKNTRETSASSTKQLIHSVESYRQ